MPHVRPLLTPLEGEILSKQGSVLVDQLLLKVSIFVFDLFEHTIFILVIIVIVIVILHVIDLIRLLYVCLSGFFLRYDVMIIVLRLHIYILK